MKDDGILPLASFFGMLSLLSIGGSNSVVPEMARHAVDEEHWLTAKAFSDVFGISQAAPGPSNLIVALIGYKVDGVPGALAAQLAMMLPAGLVMLLVTRIWLSTSERRRHVAMEHGLGPIAVGLVLASGVTVARGAGLSTAGYIAAAFCTLLFWKTKVSPLPILAAAGVLGWLRLI